MQIDYEKYGLPRPTPEQEKCPHADLDRARKACLNPRYCNDCGLQMWDAGD